MNSANSAIDTKQFATEFEKLFSKLHTAIGAQLHSSRTEFDRIDSLSLLDEGEEREAALVPTRRVVEAFIAQQDAMQKANFLTPLLAAPVRYAKLLLDLRTARECHEQATLAFDHPNARIARMAHINQHNAEVQAQYDRLPALRERVQQYQATLDALTSLQTKLVPALAAAKQDGWKSSEFLPALRMVKQTLTEDNVYMAAAYVDALRFQRKPDEKTYQAWTGEGKALLAKANGSNSGFLISRAYTNVADRSNQLARAALAPLLVVELEQHPHPSDQWQLLAAYFTDPRAMQTDAMWTIYWAMFQFSQGMSDILKRTDMREDILNGIAAEKMSRMFADWAVPRLAKFGYPKTTSYVGALQIAGSTEESRLGADLGIIIDIDIGEIKCKKVALIQAKKAYDGKTNIGSTKQQLSNLIPTPNLGNYLYYHQSSAPLFPQLPTVCAAAALAEQEAVVKRGVDARSLTLSVRELGWDWTNFMTFGMCLPDSNIGTPFTGIDEAFRILGGGSAEHLPKYLQVIAISDSSGVLEIEKKVHEKYRAVQLSRERDSPNQSRGPER